MRRGQVSSDSFGTRLRSLGRTAAYAGAALGAALVYQTKRSIDEVSELSKTTLGLERNLGLTIDQGSRWGAIAKARDIDTRSLTMSFTTLSRKMVDAAEGGETSLKTFKSLGITQAEVKKGTEDFDWFIRRLADGFGEAEGGAQRQAAAQQLLGRGYATILPLFSSGAAGLREQQRWADKYGATLDGKTLKSMENLISAQRESKVAWLGIQVAIAREAAPALVEAHKRFQDLVQIVNDPSLTREQKIERLGKMWEEMADEAGDAFEDAIPVIAEAAAHAAPRAVSAFVGGFLEADAWGKLAIGGFLLAKMGGPGAFGSVGGRIGQWIGLSTIESAAGTISGSGGRGRGGRGGRGGGGLIGALRGVRWARVGGVGLGLGLATATIEEFDRHMKMREGDLWEGLEAAEGPKPMGWDVFADIDDTLGTEVFLHDSERAARELQPLVEGLADSNAGITTEQRRQVELLARQANLTREQREQLRGLLDDAQGRHNNVLKTISLNDVRNNWSKNLRQMSGLTEKELQKIERTFRRSPEQGVKALSKSYDKAVVNIRRAMKNGEIATDRGMAAIADLMRDKLEMFGVSGAGIDKYISMKTPGGIDNNPGTTPSGRPEPTSGKQQGGFVGMVPGTGSGDVVDLHARVEPREGVFIMNRNAMAALEEWNAMFPRFGYQRGGGVRMPRATGNFPLGWAPAGATNASAARAEEILKLAKQAQAFGGGASGPAGKLRSYPHLSGDTDFTPALGEALSRMAAAAGTNISVTSGWRSLAEQRELYNRYLAGTGNLAAPPNPRAPHVRGIAADISPGRSVFGAMAGRFGLGFTVPSEDWHIELLQRGGQMRPLRGNRWVQAGSTWNEDEAATGLWQTGLSRSQAEQLSAKLMGESGGRPDAVGHDPGGTLGLGLFQITTSYNNDLISKYGGRNAMLTPIPNLFAARDIMRRQGIGAWYAGSGRRGQVHPEWTLGDPQEVLARSGKTFKKQRDAVNFLMKVGFGKEQAQVAGERWMNRNPWGGGKDAAGGGAGSGVGGGSGSSAVGADAAGSFGANLAGANMSFDDASTLLDIAAAEASMTPGDEDDRSVISQRLQLLRRQDTQLVKRIQSLNRRVAKNKGVGKMPRNPVRRKGEKAKDYQQRLADWRRSVAEWRQGARDARSEALGESASVKGDIASLTEELSSGSVADNEAQLAEELKALREELERNRRVAEHAAAIGLVEAQRLIADMISGQAGGMIESRGRTAGYGSVKAI